MATSRSRSTVSERLGAFVGSGKVKAAAVAGMVLAGGPALLGLLAIGMGATLLKGAASSPGTPWQGGFSQFAAGSPNLGRTVGAAARGVGRAARAGRSGWGR